MLRKIRLTFAVVFFAAITLMFLDITGVLHTWFGWMAKIQFLPAVLALNFGVIVLLLLLTLIFGRIYCSVICPLGVFQDVVSWTSGRRSKKSRMRFTWSPAKNWLRYGVLVLFVLALVLGAGSFVALLAPYSSYGRIVSNLFSPIYRWGNNLFAYFAERADSYAFYEADVWMKSLPTFIIAAVTFIAIVILAWRNGRTYCNTICPVGTVLGVLSKFSLFKIRIDPEKCTQCSLCSRGCKASCIDYKNHSIDHSRCVDCFDCIGTCKHGAITFSLRKKEKSAPVQETTDTSRRSFITAAAMVAGASALNAQSKTTDGGLAAIEDKKVPKRATPLVPAGALGLNNFVRHCTACQLCVSSCPNGVLRPSSDLMRLMQPEMSYERGYCRPECTACSDVCPAGAIAPITVEDKSSTQIGHAVWIPDNCIPLTDGVKCGNCARHCPAGAIMMVRIDKNDPESLRIPAVNTERCIGCGACENLCPARPFSAIYVEGHEVHRTI